MENRLRSDDDSGQMSVTSLLAGLPDKVWYLTSNGQDMWCRRPFGFLFTDGHAAESFAAGQGTDDRLFAIGVDTHHFITPEFLGHLALTSVTRIFIDPTIDATTGDVLGQVLRLAPSA